MISGDSAGCVISVSSTWAVNNLHSRLLVARRSPSPGGCRIKEDARTVGSVSAGFFTKVIFHPSDATSPIFFCTFMSKSGLKAVRAIDLTAYVEVEPN